MKIGIKGEATAEPVLSLSLKLYNYKSTNYVDVMGQDARGEEYIVARINSEGIELVNGIPERTGWPLFNGRLKLLI